MVSCGNIQSIDPMIELSY